jgi:O-methyltransferase involved in polyketide biosynthesis
LPCNPVRYNTKSEPTNSVVARSGYFDDVVKVSVKDGLEQLILGAGLGCDIKNMASLQKGIFP